MPNKPLLSNGAVMPRWKPHAAQLGSGSSWKPRAAAHLGDPATSQNTQMMGIAILSALSIAGLHSAICPSYFTMKTFASQPEAKDRAMEGLWISLGVSTVASGALYFVFRNWLPAIVSQITALGLFGIGVWAINSPPPKTIPSIEKQGDFVQNTPAAAPVQQPATVMA